jgi:hypothetical protein
MESNAKRRSGSPRKRKVRPTRDIDGNCVSYYQLSRAEDRSQVDLLQCADPIFETISKCLPEVSQVVVTARFYYLYSDSWIKRGRLSHAGRMLARIEHLATHLRHSPFRQAEQDVRNCGSRKLFSRFSQESDGRHRSALIGDGQAILYRHTSDGVLRKEIMLRPPRDRRSTVRPLPTHPAVPTASGVDCSNDPRRQPVQKGESSAGGRGLGRRGQVTSPPAAPTEPPSA